MRRGVGGSAIVANLTAGGAGTNAASWTINQDAAAGVNEDADLVLKAGDGGTDLLIATIRLDGDNDRLIYSQTKNAAVIAPWFHVGTPGDVSNVNSFFQINSGNGAIARSSGLSGNTDGTLSVVGEAGLIFRVGPFNGTATVATIGSSSFDVMVTGTRLVNVGPVGSTTAVTADVALNSGTGAAARQCILRSDTAGALDIRSDANGGLIYRRGSTIKLQLNTSDQLEVVGGVFQAGAAANLDLRSGTDAGTALLFKTGTTERARISPDGNLGLGQTTFGTDAAKVIAVGNGTAPSTSPTDAVQLYSADQAAGNATLFVRTELGDVIKLFKGAALTAADAGTVDGTYGATEAAVINNIRTRLGELEARLQAHGLIT